MKSPVKNAIILIHMICLVQIMININAQRICKNPYVQFGWLLTPPSANELNFKSTSYGGMDYYFTMHPFNYGVGFQKLFGFNAKPIFRVGFDMNFGKLFNATNIHKSLGVTVYVRTKKEYSLKLLALFGMSPYKRIFFRAGAGPNLIIYYDIEDWPSLNEAERDFGLYEIDFGLMAAGGIYVFKTDKINMPIILRIDYLARYGGMLSTSVSSGVTFSF